MRKLEKLIDSPSNWLVAVAGISTMMMMLHVTTDIVTKFVFNYQIEGTIEFVASYNMVIIVFLPLAYVAAHEGHIIVELFTRA
ncbi:MAG: TRAP transporter small permease subunit, partial [Rhodospirillales bacterium]|nr:TRAP transporter small permease subunit [Rhodospirillales bacterium]